MTQLTLQQGAAAFAVERSVAVVAGAGTGKTRVLTQRYQHLVREGVPLDRILALTFTEKAAREMKERIRADLVRTGDHERARACEFAPISTIHAFLARTLRERALDAGLDPRFQIADEMTAQLLFEGALAETVDALDAADRDHLASLGGGEEDLTALYHAARATPLALADLRPADLDADAVRAELARFLDGCAAALPVAAGKTRDRIVALLDLREPLLALDPEAGAAFKPLVSGGVGRAQQALFRSVKDLREELLALAWRAPARETGAAVVALLDRLDATYAARKRAEGLVDFADLEREGLALLRSEAGEAIAASYDHVLVDEYQDTSRIQQAILDQLARRCARFGVGDEKQSIYRFRYADAAVFAELKQVSATYPLSESFRSRPELVRFTNGLFRQVFAATDVAPQDLGSQKAGGRAPGACVELIVPQANDAAAARRLEATTLARRLRDIAEGTSYPFTYKDCAILLRTTTHLNVYERALADAGVPHVVVKGRGYYAAREVVELAHLLLLLVDPADEFRAAVVMTSLLCGATESDLLQLAGDGPWPRRAARMGERPAAIPADRWERLLRFAERFERWRLAVGRAETGDLVETILEETRFADLLLLEFDGRRRHANLAKALRRARRTDAGPATFARELLEFREREWRESEAPIAAETDEAVKIMTVHAAKGLEFPVVAVADLTAAAGASRGPYLHPEGTFAFKLKAEEGELVAPPGYAELKAWDKEQEEVEHKRLLYVALTRAEDHLILSGGLHPRCAKDNVLLDLADAPGPGVRKLAPVSLRGRRARSGGVRAALRRGVALPADLPRDDATAERVLARLGAIERRPADATPYVAAVADLVEFARCPRRYRLGRMLGIEIEDAVVEEAPERPDADEHPRRRLGTVFHEIMAELGPGAVADDAAIERYLPAATAGDRERLTEWSAWFAATPLAQRLRAAPWRAEMPFLTRIEGLAVRGVIDLYAPDLPVLLDYKTSAEVREGEYEVQVAVYLAALAELGLPAPAAAHLVYVAAREIVEVRARPAAELVSRFVAAHRTPGGFAPVPGPPCRYCEFRPACLAQDVACPVG